MNLYKTHSESLSLLYFYFFSLIIIIIIVFDSLLFTYFSPAFSYRDCGAGSFHGNCRELSLSRRSSTINNLCLYRTPFIHLIFFFSLKFLASGSRDIENKLEEGKICLKLCPLFLKSFRNNTLCKTNIFKRQFLDSCFCTYRSTVCGWRVSLSN